MLTTVAAHALCLKSLGLLDSFTQDLVPITRLSEKRTTCLTYRDAWLVGFTQRIRRTFE